MTLAQVITLLAVLAYAILFLWMVAGGPVDHAPCDCPGCEIQHRPRHLPLKPDRDRVAKGGHRA